MTDPEQPVINIYKSGIKFPPHAYDPDSSPDTEVKVTTRRNGQKHYSRRVAKPTVVRSTSNRLWILDIEF